MIQGWQPVLSCRPGGGRRLLTEAGLSVGDLLTSAAAMQLSNLLWALTVLRHCPRDVWTSAMEHFGRLRAASETQLPPEALTQVRMLSRTRQLPRVHPLSCLMWPSPKQTWPTCGNAVWQLRHKCMLAVS